VYALLAIASVAGFLAVLALWAQRQALDSDNYTESSSQLLEDPQIRSAVATYLVDQLYTQVDVTGELRDALPEQFKGLAGPAAGGVRTLAERTANAALERPRVQALWEDANRKAHEALLHVLDGGGPAVQTTGGNVTLDLGALLAEIERQTGLGGRVASRVEPGSTTITLLRSDQLAAAQTAVQALRVAAIGLTALMIVLFGLALWLARGWRRETLRAIGVLLIIVGIAALVVRRIAGSTLVDSLASTESVKPAIESAWRIQTSLLVAVAQATIAYGVVAVLAAWLAGRTAAATATRRALAPYLREPAYAYGAFAILVLLLLAWAPTQALRQPITAALLVGILAGGLEALRRHTAREFPRAERRPLVTSLRASAASLRGGPRRPEPAVAVPAPVPAATGADQIDRLERAAALHERGALTDEEFAAEKAEILATQGA